MSDWHVEQLHDRDVLEHFLRCRPGLHLYELADLDDFFFPRTTWFGATIDGALREVVLLYAGPTPTLIAFTDASADSMRRLLGEIRDALPPRFEAHLSEGLAPALAPGCDIVSRRPCLRMVLLEPERLAGWDTRETVAIGPEAERELTAFYAATYPGNWFDPHMLATGYYFGIRRDGGWVSAGGVHAVSRRYGVAALGNVVTHPDHRGAGLATTVCARLCLALRETVDVIGANVSAGNTSAIRCYERLGLATIAQYEECTCARRG
jgi:GNAT superfamily N-acetyltransferase